MFHQPSRSLLSVAVALVLCSCPKTNGGGGGVPKVKRCEVDLGALALSSAAGSGSSAKVIASADELIGGQTATGRLGDVLLKNDKVRVVIEQPGRNVGPVVYGGSIIDADLTRPAGEPGRDQFGRMAVVHALGRVAKVTDVEVVSDGSAGGSAVVAATGVDVPHDLFNLKAIVQNLIGNVTFVVDPDKEIGLRITTYFVLTPGESRVRMLTAYCNEGTEVASFPLIDLYDFRGSVEVFNPDGCAGGLGNADCLIDSSRWVAAQGSGVSYGLRSFSIADLKVPVKANATLVYGGVVGSVVEGENLTGVLTFTDPDARNRPGTFLVRPGGSKSYLRDFVIGRDLASVTAEFLRVDGAPNGKIELTSLTAAGAAAPFARVSVVNTTDDRMVTLVETDAAGKGVAVVAPGSYALSAALEGAEIGPAVNVTVVADGAQQATLKLSVSRTLTVKVADPFGAAMPAKVTVRCAAAACPFSNATWKRHLLLEPTPGGAAAVGFVPMTGTLALNLPPGQYEVVVSRGPEFSVWPDTWPLKGQPVDLASTDQTVNAVLGKILDTPGWMSADLHVHAINSTDSLVPNERRVANFLAEGVDVLISTDHDFVTDYAPVIRALGAESAVSSIIGEEVTSFSHGHFNTFPAKINPATGNNGAFDHAGGEGPTLRVSELFPGIKDAFPGAVVQINHPRGGSGALTQLKVDTATLATHAVPENFRMLPAEGATAANTKLFSDGFDALEVANGPGLSFEEVNDWMTFLSRGTVRTATGVSDSHKALATGGYSRTWARVGVDTPAALTPEVFAEAIRKNRAIITNGPFLKVTARKVDAADQPVGPAVEVGDTLSLSASANEGVELTVEVSAADWVQFDRIELYSHALGREAVNGEGNGTWPEGRILARKVLDPLALPVEPVPGNNGVALRRLKVVEKFIQRPVKDTWFAVMVRSLTSTRTLLPMVDARPFAMSNAILIDADGSGKYDDFPLKPGQPLSIPPAPRLLGPPRIPTQQEFNRALRELFHDHP